jgi:predicted glycoside hydrolase/deacetylase ChbG (UPF0249 family)
MRLVKSSEVAVLDSTTLMPRLDAIREALIKFTSSLRIGVNRPLSMADVSGARLYSVIFPE